MHLLEQLLRLSSRKREDVIKLARQLSRCTQGRLTYTECLAIIMEPMDR